MTCECGSPRCWGLMKIVVGALVLINAFLWPKWLGVDGWIAFFGVLIVLCGLFHLFSCPTCKAPAKKGKK